MMGVKWIQPTGWSACQRQGHERHYIASCAQGLRGQPVLDLFWGCNEEDFIAFPSQKG